jgi:hypothetical protein
LLALFSPAGAADEQAERRLLTGLKLFPALVAADQELGEKLGRDGRLHIVLLYREDAETANEAARRVAAGGRVKGLPVNVAALPYSRLPELAAEPPAALFLAEWSPEDLARVVRFGIEHQRVVFSPFKGDVSAGVQTGIFVSDRILPLVNREALGAAGIRLKPFLLEVAKTHE